MSNRTLVEYVEKTERSDGTYFTLEIQRLSSGRPGLMFIATVRNPDPAFAHFNREVSVMVEDGRELLAPVIEWLNGD